jgi:predicted transcriptional regulator
MVEPALKNRSKCRIFADILIVLSEGNDVRITQLVHSANVPYDRLTGYLSQMERSDLIKTSPIDAGGVYEITQKGRKYLIEYRKLEEFSNIFGVEI